MTAKLESEEGNDKRDDDSKSDGGNEDNLGHGSSGDNSEGEGNRDNNNGENKYGSGQGLPAGRSVRESTDDMEWLPCSSDESQTDDMMEQRIF